ncbi:MAG: hypothetical protein WCS01_07035, partial [bacterium]
MAGRALLHSEPLCGRLPAAALRRGGFKASQVDEWVRQYGERTARQVQDGARLVRFWWRLVMNNEQALAVFE